ncbi:hypothetical protein RIF29_36860 [Crotalaria pallida]|uniref:non-specific serine/threonine protein kinase n=1 Tax=Crotalaria pallida TaxID=3830 RepID=A0AAN9EBM0_CROPI
MEKYQILKEIGSGNFAVTKLAKDSITQELVAIKYIPRGETIDRQVQREIINHRSLRHPNIIKFKEVFLTPTHLAIVMEYAAGGEIFDRIFNTGRFSEDEQICHRDLKLENTLLDGSQVPLLKICDFGFSKSTLLQSRPKSTVGTPAYVAPEIFARKEYDGKPADVWSCGVTLYVMLFGEYPFIDSEDPSDLREVVKRITIPQIKQHPWFLKKLPKLLIEMDRNCYEEIQKDWSTTQSVEKITRIIEEAKTLGLRSDTEGEVDVCRKLCNLGLN